MFTILKSHITRLIGCFRRHGIDLRNLPALVPETYRNDSARAVEAEVKARISKLKDKIDAGAFEQDSPSAGTAGFLSLLSFQDRADHPTR